VRWFPKIVALAVLALWLPASVHCLLETLPALNILDTCCNSEAPAQNADACAQDFCGTVESGLYKVEDDPDLAVICPVILVDRVPAISDLPAVALPAPPPPTPDPGRLWLFVCRAAPQPRAPSFV